MKSHEGTRTMRNEVTVGGILGLVLGGLVTFVLAHPSAPQATVPAGDELAPLQLSDSLDGPVDAASTTAAHRPVRPGSKRVEDFALAQS